jgi:hypothetical protein
VLHCSAPAGHVLVIPDVFHSEIAVCDPHQEQLAEGAEWRWDADRNVILMGEDLTALGEFVVESVRVLKGAGVDSRFPDGFFRVHISLRQRCGTDTEDRVLLMSPAQAAAWENEFRFSAG